MFLQVLDELPFSSLSQSEIIDMYSDITTDKEDQLLSINVKKINVKNLKSLKQCLTATRPTCTSHN